MGVSRCTWAGHSFGHSLIRRLKGSLSWIVHVIPPCKWPLHPVEKGTSPSPTPSSSLQGKLLFHHSVGVLQAQRQVVCTGRALSQWYEMPHSEADSSLLFFP